MRAIHMETVEGNGSTFRITLYPDHDAPNPLEDWDELGSILSLNRRHSSFDPDRVYEAIRHNPDAVPLRYFEHGLCRWSVSDELSEGFGCPWDSVAFAGVWLPDEHTLASARDHGGDARRHFLLERAQEACEVFTQWCNGDVYGYELYQVTLCPCCGSEQVTSLESCWGIYGINECRAAAMAATARAWQEAKPLLTCGIKKLDIL